MITRNLHNYFIMHLLDDYVEFKTRSGSIVGLNVYGGNWFQYNYNLSASFTSQDSASRFCRTIRLGTGTTEPTYDDYELQQMIDAAPKTITPGRSGGYSNNYDIIAATFLNETDSDWIVTEVGQYLATSNSDSGAALLLAREVFDPVTVKPGQTFSVSMKLF